MRADFYLFLELQCLFYTSVVSLTSYPVDSNALYPANAIGDHILPPGLVSFGSADGAQTHVNPVDCVIVCRTKKKKEKTEEIKKL